MGNEKNLTHKLTVDEQRAGGKKSGESRRKKKTIQKILSDYLDTDVSKDPQFKKLAAKLGIEGDKSIKDIFTIVCLINTVKKGNLCDLEKLGVLLGERNEEKDNNGILDDLAMYLKGDKNDG